MRPVGARHDPAPSRAAYRMQRLLLTPFFWVFLRFGLPTLAIALGVGAYLADDDRRQALADGIAEMRRQIEERPEFMVRLMAIDGASGEVAEDIREIVPIDFPISSFDLDLDIMQDQIEDLDAVSRADVRIRSGGVLQVSITERVPVVVWRSADALELLDPDGRRVAPLAARAQRADLPLIAGAGADLAVAEALRVLGSAGPLSDRVRGLLRISERRWDVVLDRGQTILLPETGAVEALERVIALDQAQELFAREISIVDMRKPDRPTLRLSASGIERLRAATSIEPGAH